MLKATLEFEFTTPCFCGGSNQRESEVRAMSIRGQMRWWYRICGANQKTEAALFGSVTTGKSPLIVRVDTRDIHKKSGWDALNKRGCALKGYLWYFLAQQKRKPLPEKSKLELILSSADRKVLERGVSLAAIWITYGALGSRATRGAGCMKLIRVESAEIPELAEKINTASTLESIWQAVFPEKALPFEFRTNESVSFKNGIAAAEWLAEKWKAFRKHDPTPGSGDENIGKADHDDALRAVKKKDRSARHAFKVRRAVLGMPYEQAFRGNSKFSLKWKGAKKAEFPDMDRMTSPFHLRPIPTSAGFVPGILIFPSRLAHCPKGLYAPKAGFLETENPEKIIEKLRIIFPDERRLP